jgi:hypothetical protein
MANVSRNHLLAVSNYDRTSAILLTTIVIGSAMVLALFAIWIGPQPTSTSDSTSVTQGSGTIEVSLDSQWIEPETFTAPTDDIEHAVVAVTDVVSSVVARKQNSDRNSASSSFVGIPNPRVPGPVIPPIDPEVVPAHKRWVISYLHSDRDGYENMLKAMDIHIGIVRLHQNEIVRITDVEGQFETRISNRSQEEFSLYFQNANSRAQRWDQEIAKELNIDLAETICVHFYSSLTRKRLELLELARAELDGKKLSDVSKTRFQLAADASSDDFELTIAEISYTE